MLHRLLLYAAGAQRRQAPLRRVLYTMAVFLQLDRVCSNYIHTGLTIDVRRVSAFFHHLNIPYIYDQPNTTSELLRLQYSG